MKKMILGVIVFILVLGTAMFVSAVGESCTLESVCGFCEKCDTSLGTCVYQYNEDINGECIGPVSTGQCVCVSGATFWYGINVCQYGSCFYYSQSTVTNGYVCDEIGPGCEYYPSAEHHCAVWYDCIEGQTTANGYYVGYEIKMGQETGFCVSNIWQPSYTYWTADQEYKISVTERAPVCQQISECNNDTDCGFCQKCSAGTCVNQAPTEDLKNDCSTGYGCADNAHYNNYSGYCSGQGSCGYTTYSVSPGKVCINSTRHNVAPTADVNCGIWLKCISGNKLASKFYVGYNDDGTCNDTGWKSTGTSWAVDPGYVISQTEHSPACSVTPICYDKDGDGFTTCNGDCNDTNKKIHPGALDICGDSIDQDCSGSDAVCTCMDNDLDGYYGYNPASCPTGTDCNDDDLKINPGAAEICSDFIDNNCNGRTDERSCIVATCGDGYCAGSALGETCNTCRVDCPLTSQGACCGNGQCQTKKGESHLTCPVDCP